METTGFWNVEEIEAIYDYSKMILNITQDARHHQSFVTIEAGKLEWFVKLIVKYLFCKGVCKGLHCLV